MYALSALLVSGVVHSNLHSADDNSILSASPAKSPYRLGTVKRKPSQISITTGSEDYAVFINEDKDFQNYIAVSVSNRNGSTLNDSSTTEQVLKYSRNHSAATAFENKMIERAAGLEQVNKEGPTNQLKVLLSAIGHAFEKQFSENKGDVDHVFAVNRLQRLMSAAFIYKQTPGSFGSKELRILRHYKGDFSTAMKNYYLPGHKETAGYINQIFSNTAGIKDAEKFPAHRLFLMDILDVSTRYKSVLDETNKVFATAQEALAMQDFTYDASTEEGKNSRIEEYKKRLGAFKGKMVFKSSKLIEKTAAQESERTFLTIAYDIAAKFKLRVPKDPLKTNGATDSNHSSSKASITNVASPVETQDAEANGSANSSTYMQDGSPVLQTRDQAQPALPDNDDQTITTVDDNSTASSAAQSPNTFAPVPVNVGNSDNPTQPKSLNARFEVVAYDKDLLAFMDAPMPGTNFTRLKMLGLLQAAIITSNDKKVVSLNGLLSGINEITINALFYNDLKGIMIFLETHALSTDADKKAIAAIKKELEKPKNQKAFEKDTSFDRAMIKKLATLSGLLDKIIAKYKQNIGIRDQQSYA